MLRPSQKRYAASKRAIEPKPGLLRAFAFWIGATLVLAVIAWLLFGCKLIALGGEG